MPAAANRSVLSLVMYGWAGHRLQFSHWCLRMPLLKCQAGNIERAHLQEVIVTAKTQCQVPQQAHTVGQAQ